MRSSSSAERAVLPIALDDPRAADPAVAGAKAAALARARRAGLPVLPGVVLPVAAAGPAVAAARHALAERGVGGARPAAGAVGVPAPLRAAMAAAVDRLGGRVIARSSSPLEADHRWSGAFSSICEVRAADVATAVRSCWAAAFAPDPLERARHSGYDPAELALAVLLQPEIAPETGGLIRLDGDRAQVTAVAGHPGALLSGWVTGQTYRVDARTGRPEPVAETRPVLGDDAIAELVELARRTHRHTGGDLLEWALAAGRLHLLQVGRQERGATAPGPPASGRPGTGLPALPGAGRRVTGTVSVAGDAVGPLRYVQPHQPYQHTTTGGILVCDRPVPALAPLLFGARGLVSIAGPVDCHLVEVARALGVPTLLHTPVERITGGLDRINTVDWLAAIDGARSELVVLPAPAGRPSQHDLPSAVRTFTSALEPTRR
ncbi:PEP/pyruvate-binding domain-containing protein [Solwaraspora sp. WMMB335]|uniref:PEP/pyruvate-binding domain-containing protein n=1 Tax=Solwaraspora sp. WMMB335 TaxID=3404118 RepID=UPI003B95C3C1